MIYIDVRIANFKGEPARLFAQYDVNNQHLQVAKLLPFYQIKSDKDLTAEQLEKRRYIEKNTVLLTDSPNLVPNFDILFQVEQHLDYAAQAYLEYSRQGILALPPEIKAQANIDNVLDMRKLDIDKGMVYHLDPNATKNIHICVLSVCYTAKKSANNHNLLQSFTVKSPHENEAMSLGNMTPFTV